jgi:hypothetical protein
VLIIAGHLILGPADRDSFVTDCAAAVEQARRASACLDFAVSSPDTLDPARVNVFERRDSEAELLEFRGWTTTPVGRLLRVAIRPSLPGPRDG